MTGEPLHAGARSRRPVGPGVGPDRRAGSAVLAPRPNSGALRALGNEWLDRGWHLVRGRPEPSASLSQSVATRNRVHAARLRWRVDPVPGLRAGGTCGDADRASAKDCRSWVPGHLISRPAHARLHGARRWPGHRLSGTTPPAVAATAVVRAPEAQRPALMSSQHRVTMQPQ